MIEKNLFYLNNDQRFFFRFMYHNKHPRIDFLKYLLSHQMVLEINFFKTDTILTENRFQVCVSLSLFVVSRSHNFLKEKKIRRYFMFSTLFAHCATSFCFYFLVSETRKPSRSKHVVLPVRFSFCLSYSLNLGFFF